jgi:carboxymethylenebutenolidase
MRTICRRAVLTALAALALPLRARAGSPEELSAAAEEGSVPLTRYAADRAGKRPAVLILHGTRGVELNHRAYERYANVGYLMQGSPNRAVRQRARSTASSSISA